MALTQGHEVRHIRLGAPPHSRLGLDVLDPVPAPAVVVGPAEAWSDTSPVPGEYGEGDLRRHAIAGHAVKIRVSKKSRSKGSAAIRSRARRDLYELFNRHPSMSGPIRSAWS